MKKDGRPDAPGPGGLTRVKRRTGLKVYEEFRGDLTTTGEGTRKLASMSNLDQTRLAAIKRRAVAYREVQGVRDEIEWIDEHIDNPALGLAVGFALTAIERGLDLLDTGRFLDDILRDRARQEGTRKPRRPEIDKWIDKQLSSDPNAKSPDLWKRAPSWLTDQLGERRFATRVTARRKTRK